MEDPPRNVKSKTAKLATPPRQPTVFNEEVGKFDGFGDGTPSSEGSSLPTDFVVNLGYVLSLSITDLPFLCVIFNKFVVLFGQNST